MPFHAYSVKWKLWKHNTPLLDLEILLENEEVCSEIIISAIFKLKLFYEIWILRISNAACVKHRVNI